MPAHNLRFFSRNGKCRFRVTQAQPLGVGSASSARVGAGSGPGAGPASSGGGKGGGVGFRYGACPAYIAYWWRSRDFWFYGELFISSAIAAVGGVVGDVIAMRYFRLRMQSTP